MSSLSPLARAIDALLPQTQCTRCGYPACAPYAEAIARGDAAINQCPPGGAATIDALARLLGRASVALNPDNGIETAPAVAQIDEARCIGCAKCLPPCPVDAILGSARQMHTILIELCTGCELCIAPCPVDCISMVPLAALGTAAALPQADLSRTRFAARNTRLEAGARERAALLAEKKRAARCGAGP
ncbi:MAG TPA: RnfABCDGE type electron transport complex subunit B [Steroidobacteraceae bacterium]